MGRRKFTERLKKVTFRKLLDYCFIIHIKYALWHFAAYFPIFQSFMFTTIRPKIWRLIGVKVGRNVFIGYGVYIDVGGSNRIEIGDNVSIMAQSLLLTHKRDLSNYRTEISLQHELPFIESKIVIEDNVSIGMRSVVLPGVRIGRNSVIGAMSMVSRDVPPNVMAVGNPLKIVKEYKE